MSNLESMLTRVRAGEIDFGEFVAGTRSEFRAIACHLMRKWPMPEWFLLEDIEQELYLEASRKVWKWDKARGATLGRYVVFNSIAAAKREMHKARGVSCHGSPDKRPSVIEAPLSSFGDDGEGEALVSSLLAEEARAEQEIICTQSCRRAATAALAACTSPRERYAVLAIREAGSLDTAGRLLYDDLDHRIALRLGSEEQAERFVKKHAQAVAQRISTNDCVRSI